MEVHIENMRECYIDIISKVHTYGDVVSPRGLPTKELRGCTIIHHAPWNSLPTGIGRKLNIAFAAAEALQLIGEFSDPSWLKRINPNVEQFMERLSDQPPSHFWGAYGARIQGQTSLVVQRLRKDPDTRQAQVVLWQPDKDLQSGKLDYPCTTAIQFLIRHDKLECHVRMRSNDVWWGLAYDVFQFTQLQCSIANILGLEVGPYYHQPVSLHLYDRDLEAVQQLHDPDTIDYMPSGFGHEGMEWWHVRNRARHINNGNPPPPDQTLSEAWYYAKLGGYAHAK